MANEIEYVVQNPAGLFLQHPGRFVKGFPAATRFASRLGAREFGLSAMAKAKAFGALGYRVIADYGTAYEKVVETLALKAEEAHRRE